MGRDQAVCVYRGDIRVGRRGNYRAGDPGVQANLLDGVKGVDGLSHNQLAHGGRGLEEQLGGANIQRQGQVLSVSRTGHVVDR